MKPRKPIGFSVLACSLMGMLSSPSLAQVGPDGIDWVTVGAPGNRAYDGPDPYGMAAGRGSVNYEFKIGRYEVTTAQWMEFYNAALARPDPLPFSNQWWRPPIIWGAGIDPNYQGPGTRFILRNVADAGVLPVGGVSWRTAAVFCNWLENGKGTDASAFLNGAYDTSTFTPDIAYPTFNDQPAHNANAHYWIPTLDEYMKAVHYDPDANDGQGRWWEQPNMSDIPLVYGPPPSFGGDGSGQANSQFNLPGNAQYRIPLGSYADQLTPWGLLDAAGATAEWTESIYMVQGERYRILDGTGWGGVTGIGSDAVWGYGAEIASDRSTYMGFRLASSVPGPSAPAVFLCLGGMLFRRPCRRGSCHESFETSRVPAGLGLSRRRAARRCGVRRG